MTDPARPTGRVVLLGATGYTGELTARALVRDGLRPVLAGRDAGRLARLAASLPAADRELEQRVVDVSQVASVAALVERGDVLVSTVGPFTRYGDAALEAAVTTGAHYVDSTGEGPFVRRVVEHYGPRAEAAGSALLTAFGYDFVPGNLAGALALRRSTDGDQDGDQDGGPAAVDVGYFLTGPAGASSMSGGTRASALGVLGEQGYALRDGRIVDARPGTEVVRLTAGSRVRSAITVSATEQFTLPRLEPRLREVRVGLGWFGAATPALALLARGAGVLGAVPVVGAAAGRAGRAVAARVAPGSRGGPSETERGRTGSLVVAEVRSRSGRVLAHVELTGPNPYTLTGDLLAWAAATIAAGGLRAAGALGPVDAFGLDVLRDACAGMGLAEPPVVDGRSPSSTLGS